MTYAVQPGEFILILNTGCGHWVTVSTIETSHPAVHVYDSLYSSAGTHLKAQIAALLATESPKLGSAHSVWNVRLWAFAIASATALVLGEKPEYFFFHQSKM